MVIPGKGALIYGSCGLATVIESRGDILVVRIESNNKIAFEFTEKIQILPRLREGDKIRHRRLGRGNVTGVLSPLCVEVSFERTFRVGNGEDRGERKSSLVDTRDIHLISPAPAPAPVAPSTSPRRMKNKMA